LLEAIRTTTS
jgi:hypothetical protein